MQLFIILLVNVLAASASYNFIHLNQTAESLNSDALKTQYFELPIDHFSDMPDKFMNRWWFNDTYYLPGGPVFVLDAGEVNGENMMADLQEQPGTKTAVMQLAARYHGIGIAWEHRYYGDSVPFVKNETISSVADKDARQWSYHTMEQALEDVVLFAHNFQLPPFASASKHLASSDALHASKTPWIWLGGSYPGTRAAVLRERNPETIFAAWASSAPVQAKVNMSSYYASIARHLPKSCAIGTTGAVKHFDHTMASGISTAISSIKNILMNAVRGSRSPVSLEKSERLSPAEAAEWIRVVFSRFQSEGPKGVQGFCDHFNNASSIDIISPAEAWDTFLAAASDIMGTPGTYAAAPQAANPDTGDQDRKAWDWQYCTEFGFFQVSSPGSLFNIQSTFIDVEAVQRLCSKRFPGIVTALPKVDVPNRYGGWNINPSRVFFTDGELDPWRTLSVGSEEPDGPMRTPNSTVPGFDQTPDPSTYYGVVYPGKVHVTDFFSKPALAPGEYDAFNDGFKMFTDALDEWLPKFSPWSPSSTSDAAAALPTGRSKMRTEL